MENFENLRTVLVEKRAQGVGMTRLNDVTVQIYGYKTSKGSLQFTVWSKYHPEAVHLNFVEHDNKTFEVYVNFMEGNEIKRRQYGIFKFNEPISRLKDSCYVDKLTDHLVRQHVEQIANCLTKF